MDAMAPEAGLSGAKPPRNARRRNIAYWQAAPFALLFLLEKRDNWTVSLGLSQLAGSIEVPTTVLMAGSVILTVPIIVLFFLSERWLAGGLTAGAEKG